MSRLQHLPYLPTDTLLSQIGSGVGFLRGSAADLSKIIGEDFHLLSFDPRGVGGSRPVASCYESNDRRVAAFLANPWDVDFQAGEMYTRAENKARACQDTMGEHGNYVNTPQTAADMNSILDAIGQDKMYYWGFSCTIFRPCFRFYPPSIYNTSSTYLKPKTSI